MKYLKTYSGFASGSYLGRDDGYPTIKHSIYDDFDKLAKDFGTKENEHYYELSKMNISVLQEKVTEFLEVNLKEMRGLQAQEIREQILRLEEELKNLNHIEK